MYNNISTHQTTQEVINGIQLVLKYQKNATFSCLPYRIYFGNWYIEMYCEHKVKMTD